MLTKLKEILLGLPPENILTGIEERYAYSHDASNIREVNAIADAVVLVRNIEDVCAVVKFARAHKIPLVCRGAGTNVVGACIPEHGGIILSFAKMNKILELNKENMSARVQPGVVVGELQKQAEALGLYYPPDPSALAVSTIGGSIAQSSAGARTFKYGSTKDYVLDLLVVTADGEVLRTGSNTVKNAVGYNLGSLFTGSEGTLGIVVEATLKLIPKPECKKVILAYFDTIKDAADAVNIIIEKKILPATLDFMDKNAVQTIENHCPSGLRCDKEAALIIEVDGDSNSTEKMCETIVKSLKKCDAVQYSRTQEEYDKIWAARRSSMAACAALKPNVTTDDVIVPRENLTELIEGIAQICKKHGLVSCLIGHIGDGSIHPQIPVDYNDEDECRRLKLAKEEMYDLTARLGGVISGEHGIGLLKRQYTSKAVHPLKLHYMREIKKVFDPDNILNPGKIFPPAPDANRI